MTTYQPAPAIADWPEDAREAAQLVFDQYGEPDEISDTHVTWFEPGPWKRIVASKEVYQHNFPAPHLESVESVINYHVPPDMVSEIVAFDGSIIVERTVGEVSARCHDEQANFLALNLMHDIVTGKKTAAEARAYYAKEFADFRRKLPTPYMERLRFDPGNGDTADPDVRVLSDKDINDAIRAGEARG